MRFSHSLDSAGGAPTESFIGSKIGQASQIITGTVCTECRSLGVDPVSPRGSLPARR
jgi:hypothetical protein